MAKGKSKIQIPEKYRDLGKELTEIHQAVESGNVLTYRKIYESFIDEHSGLVGQDPNIDFNLTVFHLDAYPPSLAILLDDLTRNFVLVSENSRLIKMLKDTISINKAFDYLEKVYGYHKKKRKKTPSRLIVDYIGESVFIPAENLELPLMDGALRNPVDIARAARYVNFWNKTIRGET